MSDIPRKKSPRAPTIALDEAMERTLRAYDRERLHPTPTDVFAQNIGYKSANNGTALSVLASLRYFGLAEKMGDGLLSVSKAVEAYKYAPDEVLKRQILLGFVRTPPLYDELLGKYDSQLPSDGNLRYELIQRGFAPASAEAVLVAFRRSVEFAGVYEPESPSQPAALNMSTALAPPHEQQLTHSQVVLPALATTHAAQSAGDKDIGGDFDRIPVRLPGGRRAWLLIPEVFHDSDKSRLKAQIDLLLTSDEEADHDL